MTYFKPVSCRQIEPGAENEMFSLSRKQLNFLRKKLHSNCTLTKAYLYAKEQRILVFYALSRLAMLSKTSKDESKSPFWLLLIHVWSLPVNCLTKPLAI